ncbi:MAG: hemE [Chlamydiia bacterium]|nr:hemE [Chlamydiia bacterium]
MNNLLLKALKAENFGKRPPVWLMRQAGRYMASYQKLREKHSFLGLCREPELIAEVTELPIKEFGFDAAILFSDILLITEALGAHLHFEEGKGPILQPTLESGADVEKLYGRSAMPLLSHVVDGVRLLKERLDVPLIGFAGAPFTVASYMIEGKSTRDFAKTKKWMFNDPKSFHELLTIIADMTADYLNHLIDAGCDAIQLFDSWAHVLPAKQCEEFSFYYMRRIQLKLKSCPLILFCRGSSIFYEGLAALSPQGIGLDWQCDIAAVRKKLPQIVLQGNLDPDILLADSHVVEKEVKSLLEKMRGDPAFIFNLGHGILPTTPEKNVKTLVRCIHEFA